VVRILTLGNAQALSYSKPFVLSPPRNGGGGGGGEREEKRLSQVPGGNPVGDRYLYLLHLQPAEGGGEEKGRAQVEKMEGRSPRPFFGRPCGLLV